MIFNKIYKKIKQYDEIVVARHIGPDPDAVASTIALRDTIKLTFPNKKVYAVGRGVARFKHFGVLDRVNEKELNNPLLIVLDLPNTTRIDSVEVDHFKEIVKIDHHPFEEKMGEVEWIDETASSTSQMIIELIFKTRLKMNKTIAENLFMGVVSDSERFLLDYTTPKTFDLVSKLIKETKIDFLRLYDRIYIRPLNEVLFQSYITQNLIISENGFAYIKISKETIEEYKVDLSSASNMVNNFNYIKEIIAWAFVVYDEKTELFKVNIRSRGPIINKLASEYNGGGHKYASGARLKTEEEVDNLFADLDKLCSEYMRLNSEDKEV